MKILPQRSPKMLPELFEDTFGCPRIMGKPERKFEGHICNIKLEKLKFVRLSLFFWIWCPIIQSFGQKWLKNELIVS